MTVAMVGTAGEDKLLALSINQYDDIYVVGSRNGEFFNPTVTTTKTGFIVLFSNNLNLFDEVDYRSMIIGQLTSVTTYGDSALAVGTSGTWENTTNHFHLFHRMAY